MGQMAVNWSARSLLALVVVIAFAGSSAAVVLLAAVLPLGTELFFMEGNPLL